MSYGLIGLKRQMEGEAMQGLGDLANQQRQAEMQEEQMEQAKRQQTMSAVGTGAGIGMMAGGPWGAAIGAGIGLLAGSLF
ncbi:hypothetical protein HPA02_08470 [Bisbaumannia pacifica]|uniref:Bacteriocin n=1 Tax=Bisbaumannia pacifica TaxID=77098 RepID=A0A510X567_9GAMM|nr:bacteriocin [Halomonas pacifica]GEK46564.1 hypothetical protein HPA02_08470 [Halomonas pacifica]